MIMMTVERTRTGRTIEITFDLVSIIESNFGSLYLGTCRSRPTRGQ